MVWGIVASLLGVFGIAGTLTFLGFFPMLAPVFGAILSAFLKIIEILLSTRIGVALLTAAVVAAIVFPIAEFKGATDITLRWKAADAAATIAAKDRDSHIAAEAVAEAQAENAAIKQTSDELAQKVADYETELAKRPANSSCVLTPDDARRLRDISGQGQPKASSPNLGGVRATGGKSPAPVH